MAQKDQPAAKGSKRKVQQTPKQAPEDALAEATGFPVATVATARRRVGVRLSGTAAQLQGLREALTGIYTADERFLQAPEIERVGKIAAVMQQAEDHLNKLAQRLGAE